MEGVAHALFSDRGAVERVLADLRRADLGISIVMSGMLDSITDICKRAKVQPHTVGMSLGVWGRTELLPGEEVRELCSMCGHALVSPSLVETMVKEVREGSRAPWHAAIELAKQCTCNVINADRTYSLIVEMAGVDPGRGSDESSSGDR
jgi:hypothetical protein